MKNNKIQNLIIFFIVIGIFCISVGYSAIQTRLTISGTATVKVSADIFINEVSGPLLTNSAVESFSPAVDDKTIIAAGTLPNVDSTVSYYITFYNNTSKTWQYDGLSQIESNNDVVIYETSGLNIHFTIAPFTSATIKLTFKYLNTVTVVPETTTFGASLQFDFREYNVELADLNPYVSNGLLLNLKGIDPKINNSWIDATTDPSNPRVITLYGDTYQDAVNKSYVFDGDGDYGTATAPYIPETDNFTIEVYLQTQATAYASTVDHAIISQVANSSNSAGRFKINVFKKNDTMFTVPSLITFYSNTSSAYSSPPSQQNGFITNISTQTKYHLQLVRRRATDGSNKGTLEYYVNGNRTNTITMENDAKISQENLKISRFNNNNLQYFRGSIFAIRIYNRVLSESELIANYQADLANYVSTDVAAVLTEKLIDMAITYDYTSGATEGLQVDPTDTLTYKGSNPHNYLKIDGKDYRILSFRNNGTVRLMRITNPLTPIPYDTGETRTSADTYCNSYATNGCNAWTTYEYLSTRDQPDLSPASGTVLTEASLNIYLNQTFLNDTTQVSTNLKNILVDGSYNIGSIDQAASFALAKTQSEAKVWIGKVGIMTAIDAMSASINIGGIEDTTIANNYITAYSHSKNINLWTINASSHDSWDVWTVISPTAISKRRASRTEQTGTGTFYAYPTIHLDSKILVTGNGTVLNPYIISFD